MCAPPKGGGIMGPQSTAWTPNQFLLKSWGHRYYNTKGNIWLIARSAKHPNLPRKWGWIRTLGLIYTLYLCHVWDGWIASPTQWTWVWANSGRQWRTGEPGMWQFMGVQSRTQLRDWTTAIRQITNENLLYSTGNSTQCSVVTQREGNPRKRGYLCTCSWFTLLYNRN